MRSEIKIYFDQDDQISQIVATSDNKTVVLYEQQARMLLPEVTELLVRILVVAEL
jgi:hypothetical protein